jgi:hypothetical protein
MSAHHDDFDFEPVRGLPQVLPKGERMLWQGAPRWQDLAVHAFHARKVIWYFVAIAVVQGLFRYAEGQSLAQAVGPFQWLAPTGIFLAAVLTGVAMLSARTTVYTVTNKRLVMRVGMALPVTVNLPFSQIDGASLRLFSNGSGDIPLKLTAKERVAFLLLWPHARPFHFAKPQPCLRCIANADQVAGLLAAALAGTAATPLTDTSAGRARPASAQPVAA